MESLDAPKKWFQLHVDTVMQAYGSQHRIQREDLVLGMSKLIFIFYHAYLTVPSNRRPSGAELWPLR
jgi:hypothetical protein